MFNKILLFIFIFLSLVSYVQAKESFSHYICVKNGKIRYFYKDVSKYLNSKYCYRKDFRKIISKNCLEKKCYAIKRILNNFSFIKYSNIGNPLYDLCNKLGGIGQVIEFKTKKNNWKKLNRCFFHDKSFVSMSMLTQKKDLR